MKKVIILFVLSLFPIIVYTQGRFEETMIALDVYEIVDKNLEPILDSIISVEMEMEYYRTDGFFSIAFYSDTTFVITSMVGFLPYYSKKEIGVLKYKGSPFIISYNLPDERILKKSSNKEKYKFIKNTSYIDESGVYTFIKYDDSGISSWYYGYNDGEFVLLNSFISPRHKKF